MKLHVRIRGRSHGPFETTKLIEMVQRGQLTRVSSVSEDGAEWKKAAEYPELFDQSRTVRSAPRATQKAETTDAVETGVAHTTSAPPSQSNDWYYSDGSAPTGPVAFGQLKSMFDTGTLSRDTLVWKKDFDDWRLASDVPGLTKVVAQHLQVADRRNAVEPQEQRRNELDPSVVHAFADAAGWVMFAAVILYVLSALSFLSFVFLISGSASNENWSSAVGMPAGGIVEGIGALIQCGITGVMAFHLTRYSRASGRLRYSKSQRDLLATARAAKSFWLFVGVVVIVELVLFSLLLLFAVSAAGSITNSL